MTLPHESLSNNFLLKGKKFLTQNAQELGQHKFVPSSDRRNYWILAVPQLRWWQLITASGWAKVQEA